MHTILFENHPKTLLKNVGTTSVTSLLQSSIDATTSSVKGRHRRKSEDDQAIDYFLTKKEL